MADVVDVIEDSPPAVGRRPLPTREELRAHLEAHLQGRDLAGLSLKGLRRELEQRLGLAEGGLDSRREELKALAQAYAQAATAAAQAPSSATTAAGATATAAGALPPQGNQPTLEPPAKRQKSLLVGGGAASGNGPAMPQPAATSGAAPAAPPPKAAAKRGPIISAYSLWCNDNRARITQEMLAARGGVKPSFGEVCKAVSEGWKQVLAEERTVYEQKAAAAKAEAAAAEPQQPKAAKAPKEPKPGKGGGKGSKGAAAAAAAGGMTRAEFLKAGQKLRCNLSLEGASPEELGKGLQSFALAPRIFKSGTTGWFQMAEMRVPVGGREIIVKAQLNVLVSGSKHWLDGDDLPAGVGDGAAPDGSIDLEATDVGASEPAAEGPADARTPSEGSVPKGSAAADGAAEAAAAAAVALDEGTDNAAAHAGA